MNKSITYTQKQFRSIFNNHVITWCENDEQNISNIVDAYYYIKRRFNSEFSDKKTVKGFTEWLEGLALLNIPFTHADKLNFAKEIGVLPEYANEDQKEEIIENFFPYIASTMIKNARKLGINIL